jgi:phosphate transport system substrate-binding protein
LFATLSRRRVVRTAAVACTFALLATACGSSSKDSNSGSGGGSGSASATLNGSGSTFQAPFNEVAIQAFHDKEPNVTINYGGGGSGKGKTDLQTKTVDFAGTDSTIKPEDTSKYQGGTVLYFPTVVAPITVSYHLSGVDKLQVSGPTLAGIFSGTITKWNAPELAADNPGVTLPANDIVIAHRADA